MFRRETLILHLFNLAAAVANEADYSSHDADEFWQFRRVVDEVTNLARLRVRDKSNPNRWSNIFVLDSRFNWLNVGLPALRWTTHEVRAFKPWVIHG